MLPGGVCASAGRVCGLDQCAFGKRGLYPACAGHPHARKLCLEILHLQLASASKCVRRLLSRISGNHDFGTREGGSRAFLQSYFCVIQL